MKITNLEKFALEQIYRPYSLPPLGEHDTRLERLGGIYTLDNVLMHFQDNPKWRDLIMDRIVRCKFQFPKYIRHPLVEFIKNYEAAKKVKEK